MIVIDIQAFDFSSPQSGFWEMAYGAKTALVLEHFVEILQRHTVGGHQVVTSPLAALLIDVAFSPLTFLFSVFG